MSKSLKRVRAALEAAGVTYDLREMSAPTRTAQRSEERRVGEEGRARGGAYA